MTDRRILITGSEGLVGMEVGARLEKAGYQIVGFDLHAEGDNQGDIRDAARVQDAMAGCVGIIHLAAVSRVVTAERNPQLCQDVNINGLSNVLQAATQQATPPWLLLSSSREVYGHPAELPVAEDAPLSPVNVYGRSKQESERMVMAVRDQGLCTAIVRLSNVYGRVSDHEDRVIPAFARAAVQGQPLRVEGADHTFDFTHIDDTADGITQLVALLEVGRIVPPTHLVTGKSTTLGELAAMAIRLADSASIARLETPRNYDVSQFVGNPEESKRILDWAPRIDIAEGLKQLIADLRVHYSKEAS